MSHTAMWAKRQQVLATFGEFALQSDDLDAVLTEACRLVAEALGTHRAKVLEIQSGGRELLLRAGVGWEHGIVRTVRLPMGEKSSESFSIKERKPIISRDIRNENRFTVPDFMKEAGIVALANVPIFLPGDRAYGLLQVDATEPRDFSDEDTEFLRTYAIILGPMLDRLFKVKELNSGEERFRLVVQSARDYAIFLTDAEDHITDWLPGAEAVFGWKADEIIGKSASILFTHEDREQDIDREEIETARRDGMAPNVRWHLRKDGRHVFIDGAVTALKDAAGRATAFLKIGQDVTERRRSDERLRESEERFRQFAEASSDLLWIKNADTLRYEYVSPAVEAIYGIARENIGASVEIKGDSPLVHPEDRARAAADFERLKAGESVRGEYRILHQPDAEHRWINCVDFPILDEADRIVRLGGIVQDVTEERRASDTQKIMVAELQHRTRNLIGVVRSIASQLMRATGGTSAFRPAFNDRLEALSRVQSLLSRAEIEPITIEDVLRLELDALGADAGSDRVTLAGPKVRLRNRMVQTFSLAIHELATNARKYGALANNHGRLSIVWSVSREEGKERRLLLEWVESGLDIRKEIQSPATSGYGRELIERALPYTMRAKTTYELGTDGLRCTIDLPLDKGRPRQS